MECWNYLEGSQIVTSSWFVLGEAHLRSIEGVDTTAQAFIISQPPMVTQQCHRIHFEVVPFTAEGLPGRSPRRAAGGGYTMYSAPSLEPCRGVPLKTGYRTIQK